MEGTANRARRIQRFLSLSFLWFLDIEGYRVFQCRNGVANIAHNEVTLLVRTAERAEDIDAARAAAAEKRARGYLADKSGAWDMDRAEMALRRSLARQSAVLMLKRRS